MNIGILGAGNIAATMAETIRAMKLRGEAVDLYAVASRSQSKAEAFAARFQVHKAYGSYEEMLKDSGVDLVYIATPHSCHYEQMLLCIRRNKAVLCEKAFTANADQARKALMIGELKRVPVTEAIWTRYMPMRRILKKALDSGVIGQPRTLTANLSYNIWQNERIHEPELAGGALLDVGVYPLNFAEMMFGMPDRVQSSCVKGVTGVDQSDAISLFWEDGRMAVLTAGTTAISDRQGIIYGDEGYLVVDNINNPLHATVYDLTRSVSKEYDAPEQISGYEYEIREMKQVIEEGYLECPSMPHESTVAMMKLFDAIRAQMGVRYPFEAKEL